MKRFAVPQIFVIIKKEANVGKSEGEQMPVAEEIESQLKKLPYYSELNEEQKRLVSKNTVIRHYQKGNLIHGVGETCLGMIYVLKGVLRVFLMSEEGREITLFRLTEKEPCVLSASCVLSQITFDTQIVVEKDCDLLVVNSEVYGKLTEENIRVRCFTYELMCERFSTIIFAMQQILFSKFDERLALFLLSEYDRTGNKEINMTHEQIAKQINSAREVVARMLKRFLSDELIEMKRGTIILKDIEALRKI